MTDENLTYVDPDAIVVSETVEINAPASVVWDILIDMEKQLSWALPHYDAWPYPARRDQFIESTGSKSCRYHSTDQFLGPNGIHVMRFAGPWVKKAFDDTAHALKAHAEKMYNS